MTIYTKYSSRAARHRARNRTILGIILSVLVHIGLFVLVNNSVMNVTPPAASEPPPLQVSLLQPKPAVPVVKPEPPAPPVPPKPPKPPKQVVKPQPRPRVPQVARSQSNRAPSPHALTPTPVTPPSTMQHFPAEMDMSTMIQQRQAQRHAAEESAAAENAAARAAEAEPSANDIARANIAFQERRAEGNKGGVFEIISKGPRVAQYVFRGWNTNSRHGHVQTFTVDAGPGGDVERAIVDDMIRVIRLSYKGDFVWRSYKLGRDVTLSAREEDTAGLRAFMLRELFK